jgi:hypothetical protein
MKNIKVYNADSIKPEVDRTEGMTNEEMGNEMVQEYNKLAGDYKKAAEAFRASVNLYKKACESHLQEQNDRIKKSHELDLALHFIVENGLEEKYLKLLQVVSEDETDADYQEAAQSQLDTHKDGMIYDEYGGMKEEREFERLRDGGNII